MGLQGLGYGGIYYMDKWYELITINVHAKSEHTFGGLHYPLELHLVHKRTDNDNFVIVAIPVTAANPPSGGPAPAPAPAAPAAGFIEENASSFSRTALHLNAPAPSPAGAPGGPGAPGPAAAAGSYMVPGPDAPNFNPALQWFVKAPPPDMHMKAVPPVAPGEVLDINTMMQGGTFFEYAGSLTAPPCAEDTIWMVRREPIMAADLQVANLYNGIIRMTDNTGNDRAVMPLNGRQILVRQAVREVPPKAVVDFPPGMPTMTAREPKAIKWSNDALTMAKSAADYVKYLDTHLRQGAVARAEAFPMPVLTTPPPAGITTTPRLPRELANTAQSMSASIAGSAREAVANAVQYLPIPIRPKWPQPPTTTPPPATQGPQSFDVAPKGPCDSTTPNFFTTTFGFFTSGYFTTTAGFLTTTGPPLPAAAPAAIR